EYKKNLAVSEIKKFCELKSAQEKNLEDFVIALLQENQQFNFIGKSTILDIWERHILDSAQLMRFIPNKNAKFADFGAGAGFPGMVLSILGLREIHLVEKAFRKADFLRKAKLFSPNRVFIHQTKLEEMPAVEFDCIVSRALAPLPGLLTYSKKFLKKGGYCLFLKGKNLPQEIIEAQKNFQFEYELQPSLTSAESNIIKVSNIKSEAKC
ncbi:MAG: 16S rRNA (guanine(527)-N(7))-methyltransferase RsmG, partial [Alphaproteobacteria bacterium]|nr:16S rRNA (guanine(527)-N(7))-methyltransferase RsmG [Alphaproteobacteria bacterium]